MNRTFNAGLNSEATMENERQKDEASLSELLAEYLAFDGSFGLYDSQKIYKIKERIIRKIDTDRIGKYQKEWRDRFGS